MVFYPDPRTPELPLDPPDSVPIAQVLLEDGPGRQPVAKSLPAYTCGLTGRTYTVADLRTCTEALAQGLRAALKWEVASDQHSKIVGFYSLNAMDYMPAAWAVHRLGGIAAMASAGYVAAELTSFLRQSRAGALFTCAALLSTAREAAAAVGLPSSRIFLIDVARIEGEPARAPSSLTGVQTVDDLVRVGQTQPPLPPLAWKKGQGKTQIAFLCFSSGTSGLPKGVMVSHYNVIANTLQVCSFERLSRDDGGTQMSLGLLPYSHIYALVVIMHAALFRGDGVVVLPRYSLKSMLKAIEQFRINALYLVPPILLDCLRETETVKNYDLSCAVHVMTGAASFGGQATENILALFPNGVLRQGYGMTESATVISSAPRSDPVPGSSGTLLPRIELKLVDETTGEEKTGYGEPGEIWVRSPGVTLGYLNNETATRETYIHPDGPDDGRGPWLRTGDKGEMRRSPSGYEHLFILDRIKDLIKVKGMQVAPAELEAALLEHPDVVDAAVVPVPDARDGEVPKAFVVPKADATLTGDALIAALHAHIEKTKSRPKWLRGGIIIATSIPKSPSGKILRRLLREPAKPAAKL